MRLLVDGDIIAFKASASCEISQKAALEGKTEIDPDYAAWSRAATTLERLSQFMNTSDIKIYLTGKGNFRYDIYSKYKANRPDWRPTHLQSVREYLIKKFNAVVFDNIEADDAIVMDHVPGETIICSNDKDFPANAYGGFINFTKPEEEWYFEVSPEEMEYNFAVQMLLGDRADNIVGPYGFDSKKKAARILKLGPPYDAIIQHHYLLNFPYNPDGVRQLNYRLLRLLRSMDELEIIKQEQKANIYTEPQSKGKEIAAICAASDSKEVS